jgi:hypothetical protein
MKIRVPILLLAAAAVVSGYVVLLIGDVIPRFFQVAYKETTAGALDIMPVPTRFASEYAWLFALVVLLVVIVAALCLRHSPTNAILISTVGLCAQGAVVWAAMFCFCYKAFCGPMSLHHGPAFDPAEFVSFEAGVFPITLAALLAPIIALCIHRKGVNSIARVVVED